MTKPKRPFAIEYRFLGAVASYARKHGLSEWRVKGRYKTERDRDQAIANLSRKDVGLIEYRLVTDPTQHGTK